MKKQFLCGLSILTLSAVAFSQETTASSLEWAGYLDFYYQSSPQGHIYSNGPRVVEGRFFDRHINEMTLNMAEVSMKKTSGKVSFKADVAFGEMVDQLSGGGSQLNSSGTNIAALEPTRNITQASVTYNANDRLALSAGKFYTHMGLEVTKAKDNWQYSRSYIFNYAIPFWHQGVSVSYAFKPKSLTGTFYVLNAADGRIAQEQNESNTLGVNLNYTGVENLALNYNYIGGAESTNETRKDIHELNATYKINDDYTLALDYVVGTQKKNPILDDTKWSGVSIHFKAKINDTYTLSPRLELFDDSDSGAVTGVSQKIMAWTLANNFNLGDGLESRLELRSDKSDSDLFFKKNDGSSSDTQQTYTVALLYSF